MLLNIDLGISDFPWDSHGKLFFPRVKFLNAFKESLRVKMMCQFERHYQSLLRIEVRKPHNLQIFSEEKICEIHISHGIPMGIPWETVFPREKFLNTLKKSRRLKMMCQFERHYQSLFRIEVRKPQNPQIRSKEFTLDFPCDSHRNPMGNVNFADLFFGKYL